MIVRGIKAKHVLFPIPLPNIPLPILPLFGGGCVFLPEKLGFGNFCKLLAINA